MGRAQLDQASALNQIFLTARLGGGFVGSYGMKAKPTCEFFTKVFGDLHFTSSCDISQDLNLGLLGEVG